MLKRSGQILNSCEQKMRWKLSVQRGYSGIIVNSTVHLKGILPMNNARMITVTGGAR